MLRNYLLVALRNVVRRRLYSAINIVGLSIGIAFCILSFLYVRHERSFDRFHMHSARIFLAYQAEKSVGGGRPGGWTPPVLAAALKASVGGVEEAIRVHGGGLERTVVRRGDTAHHRRLLMVDPALLTVFSFPRIAGQLQGALDDPGSVVISSDLVSLFFGAEDPVGQTLSIYVNAEPRDFTVSAVTRAPPNSSLQFDLLLSHELRGLDFESWGWGSNHVLTFVLASEGTDREDLEQNFADFFDEHFAEDRAAHTPYWGGPGRRLRLIPLQELYLNTTLRPFITLQSSPVYVYVLSGLGVSVLLIACINFMNLSLGLASTRLSEVGVRKALGAMRLQLAHQFVGEAILLSTISLGLAVGLAELVLPAVSELLQRPLAIDYAEVWPALVMLGLLVGLLTGSYPALVFTKLRPVGNLQASTPLGGVGWVARILVVLQLSLSTALIAASLIMVHQLTYLRTVDLGFRSEQVLVIDASQGVDNETRPRLISRFRELCERDSRVRVVSASNMSYGVKSGYGTVIYGKTEGESLRLDTYSVDYDYADVLSIPLRAGRSFSAEFPSDQEESLLVNEALARHFGWQDPIGERIPSGHDGGFLSGSIIGVLADTHIQPLRHELEPALYRLGHGRPSLQYILVRVSTPDLHQILTELERTWHSVVPEIPFGFTHMDEDVARTFAEDERWMRMARHAAFLATFLACLGAFGLTSLAVARRTREIGIRKALGASATDVAALLSREFALLVVAGSLIAWPAASLAMHRWLSDFPYHIEPGITPLLVAASLTLVVVLMTVASQAVRAAQANPIDCLRRE
jgi:putative ABC transport system permease protein